MPLVMLMPGPASAASESEIATRELTISTSTVEFTGEPVEALTVNWGVPGPTLHFTEGQWQTWPWTYPDYHRPEYHAFFMQVRERLKEQRRQTADPPHPPNGNSP